MSQVAAPTGPYVIYYDKKLGEGSYGCVSLGRMKSDGQEVAVKVTSTAKAIQTAKEEVAILEKLKGAKNIVQILASYSVSAQNAPTSFTFAMERAPSSLDRLMKEGDNITGLPYPVLIDLMADVASALRSMRSHNIAHRDIKIANILVFRTPANDRKSTYLFKLCDLGCSSIMSTDTNGLSTLVGSPNYLHPKLAFQHVNGIWRMTEKYSGDECDCWSLGCALFYCATGHFAFPSNDKNVYYSAVQNLPEKAISATLDGGSHTSSKFNYEDTLSNDKYPLWFRKGFSTVLQMLFHHPSTDILESMTKTMQACNEVTLVVPNLLTVTTYVDFTSNDMFCHDFPTLHDVVDVADGQNFSLISSNKIVDIRKGTDSAEYSTGGIYFVLADYKHREFSRSPTREVLSQSDIEICKRNRLRLLQEGIVAQNDSNKMADLVAAAVQPLLSHYSEVRGVAAGAMSSAAFPLRFSEYCSSIVKLIQYADREKKHNGDEALEAANRAQKEIAKHMEKLNSMVVECDIQREKLNQLKVDNPSLPGIEDELCRYNDMRSCDDYIITMKIAASLVTKCFERRSKLAAELRDGENSVLQIILSAAVELCKLKANLRQLENEIDNCTMNIERLFQVLKDIVKSLHLESNINEDDVRRVKAFYKNTVKISTSAAHNNDLAKKLEERLQKLLEDVHSAAIPQSQ